MPRKSLDIEKTGGCDFLSTSSSRTESFNLGKADMDAPLGGENQ